MLTPEAFPSGERRRERVGYENGYIDHRRRIGMAGHAGRSVRSARLERARRAFGRKGAEDFGGTGIRPDPVRSGHAGHVGFGSAQAPAGRRKPDALHRHDRGGHHQKRGGGHAVRGVQLHYQAL